ncbi:hypothetical protein C5O19_08630 [Siphonobacter curvatus]|uniref:Uncharacterized protein n=2 Tax=Siphonobacter curvatus TaxID=2094562 RepID=A0A2S7IPR9_9BACT|nr:hypothetical protein [Siphonobacter curvatus]PQA59682.1 hypothetical protein C5O19_08630 [Siphonobacter curvatus]
MDSLLENRPGRQHITNYSTIVLIDSDEFERIENKGVGEEETFELIDAEVKEIMIRNQMVAFNNNYEDYEQLGIEISDYDNPKKLISFDNVLRYFNETNPALISATEDELRQYLPKDLPKLMTLDSFHFMSRFEDDKFNVPSSQETFQLIAKVLATQDPAHWKPTQEPNNHWSNWESGWL